MSHLEVATISFSFCSSRLTMRPVSSQSSQSSSAGRVESSHALLRAEIVSGFTARNYKPWNGPMSHLEVATISFSFCSSRLTMRPVSSQSSQSSSAGRVESSHALLRAEIVSGFTARNYKPWNGPMSHLEVATISFSFCSSRLTMRPVSSQSSQSSSAGRVESSHALLRAEIVSGFTARNYKPWNGPMSHLEVAAISPFSFCSSRLTMRPVSSQSSQSSSAGRVESSHALLRAESHMSGFSAGGFISLAYSFVELPDQ